MSIKTPTINGQRLLDRLHALGEIGRDRDGRLTRLALSDQDRDARNQVRTWMKDLGMTVRIDQIGNLLGFWGNPDRNKPVMIGSHIDTVINAGMYDGSYGVLAGLEVVNAIQEAGITPSRPIAIGAFTNEEGVRYTPDMMGSLVYAGGLPTSQALASRGVDGTILSEELDRIGYKGSMEPGEVVPHAFIELHIEQGPVLESEQTLIGAVQDLQGISWQRVNVRGRANHAGTTPTRLRADAGLAAARIVTFLRDIADRSEGNTVATVGTMQLSPNAINVIPSAAEFTVDLRDPDEQRLQQAENDLSGYLVRLQQDEGVEITTERLARFEPVIFDPELVTTIEKVAVNHGLAYRRMTSGAGHDAQMMARICPAAMIFVPSRDGISHNPLEHTDPDDLSAGASVLLDVTLQLTD